MNRPSIATCIQCGCTDLQACPGGCSWTEVDRETGCGVCSRCQTRTDDRLQHLQALREQAPAARIQIGPTDV